MEAEAILADSVVVAEGKLYIQGGGWNRIFTPSPAPFVYEQNIGVGIVIRVPYTATNQQHELALRLENEDGQVLPIGTLPENAPVTTEDGRIRRLGTVFNLGRPADLLPGEESIIPFAVILSRVEFPEFGTHSIIIEIDGTVVKRLPFRVLQVTQPTPIIG